MFVNFRHLRDLIELNDKKYLLMFHEADKRSLMTSRTQDKALVIAQKSTDKMYKQLLETYQTGHVDLVQRVDKLTEQITLNKGKDAGYTHLIGWMFAGITLITSLGMIVIEAMPEKDGPVAIKTNALIAENTAITHRNNELLEAHSKQVDTNAVELQKLHNELVRTHPH